MKEGSAGTVVQAVTLCLASLVLALVGGVIPIAGSFFALLTPLPLILLSLRAGRVGALLGMLAVGICVAGLLGPGYAWFFYIQFGLPAMVLAETIRRQWTPEVSVAAGSVTVLMGGLVGLVLAAWGAGGSLLDFLQHRLDIAVRDAMELYSKMGVSSDEVGPLFGSVDEVRTFLLTASPGLFMAAALLSTSANFFLARRGAAQVAVAGGPAPGFTWRVSDLAGMGVYWVGGLAAERSTDCERDRVQRTACHDDGLFSTGPGDHDVLDPPTTVVAVCRTPGRCAAAASAPAVAARGASRAVRYLGRISPAFASDCP